MTGYQKEKYRCRHNGGGNGDDSIFFYILPNAAHCFMLLCYILSIKYAHIIPKNLSFVILFSFSLEYETIYINGHPIVPYHCSSAAICSTNYETVLNIPGTVPHPDTSCKVLPPWLSPVSCIFSVEESVQPNPNDNTKLPDPNKFPAK